MLPFYPRRFLSAFVSSAAHAKLSVGAAFAAFVLPQVACTASEPAETAGAEEAIVSEATFERAKEIVDGLDYLPLGYKKDGCYARALYLAMELGKEGIESNSVFVFPPEGALGLSYPDNVERTERGVRESMWLYHVAPVLEIDTKGGVSTAVIDPSLSPAPLALDAWLSKMGVTWESTKVGILKGAIYGTLDRADGMRRVHESSWRDELTASFEDMPPFQVSEIQQACRVMHVFVTLEAAADGAPTRDANEAERRAAPKLERLHARTTELVDALARRSKLAPSPDPFSDETCTKAGRVEAGQLLAAQR